MNSWYEFTMELDDIMTSQYELIFLIHFTFCLSYNIKSSWFYALENHVISSFSCNEFILCTIIISCYESILFPNSAHHDTHALFPGRFVAYAASI
jgi:hypothetical protein